MSDPVREILLPKFATVSKAGAGFKVRCPVPDHDDHDPSLSIRVGRNGRPLIKCFGGCADDDVIAALGLTWKDLGYPWGAERPVRESDPHWLPCQHDRKTRQRVPGHEWIAEYLYHDRHGRVAYGVSRCAHKCFPQWRPDATSPTGRRWGLTGKREDGTSKRLVPMLPYRLPEILAGIAAERTIWLAEGERDADSLAAIGVPATNSKNFGPEHARYLAGADVIVVADRDMPGWRLADGVIDALLPVARSIEVVRAAVGKDSTDHLAGGLRLVDFVTLAEPKPLIIPPGGPYPAPPVPTDYCGCFDCAREGR